MLFYICANSPGEGMDETQTRTRKRTIETERTLKAAKKQKITATGDGADKTETGEQKNNTRGEPKQKPLTPPQIKKIDTFFEKIPKESVDFKTIYDSASHAKYDELIPKPLLNKAKLLVPETDEILSALKILKEAGRGDAAAVLKKVTEFKKRMATCKQSLETQLSEAEEFLPEQAPSKS